MGRNYSAYEAKGEYVNCETDGCECKAVILMLRTRRKRPIIGATFGYCLISAEHGFYEITEKETHLIMPRTNDPTIKQNVKPYSDVTCAINENKRRPLRR
jgi:hypothetical protein